MTHQEIVEKLRTLMKKSSTKQVDWNSMTEEASIESLGFDSLSILDLIYDVQCSFGLEFDAEEVAGVKTVGDMVTFLESKTRSAAG